MKKIKVVIAVLLVVAVAGGFAFYRMSSPQVLDEMPGDMKVYAAEVDLEMLIEEKNLSTIYFAGGCFWGVEEYMARIAGVYDAESGYANGNTEKPTYQDVISQKTGHAETVKVVYDSKQVSLKELLDKLFLVVDPTSVNKQGNDIGIQYRSGVYYTDETDRAIIDESIKELEEQYDKEIVVEVLPLDNYYPAEEYHQDYLQKNPYGYCHIDLDASADQSSLIDASDYTLPSEEEIREMLSNQQYDITQNGGTERAFTHEYDKLFDVGIYVDIITGEPLFLSSDKYDSGTGWPSFTRPISKEVLIETVETTFGGLYTSIEIKSRVGESHLGHVFGDGPADEGGLRYCMNGDALRFVPYNEMTREGYGYLKHLLENDNSIEIIEE